MKRFLLILILILFVTETDASIEEKIIQNFDKIKNISFDFEQNINGKIEKGNCTVQYPKKINCKYNSVNKKILISNGKSLVIKTKNDYYIYPLEKTALNLILDKKFLIKKIKGFTEKKIIEEMINYKFTENGNEFNIFFNKNSYDLIAWQTSDIYQNLNITYLYSIKKNQELKKNLFKLPTQD